MSGSEKEQDSDVESKRVDGEELMCKQFPRRVAALSLWVSGTDEKQSRGRGERVVGARL